MKSEFGDEDDPGMAEIAERAMRKGREKCAEDCKKEQDKRSGEFAEEAKACLELSNCKQFLQCARDMRR